MHWLSSVLIDAPVDDVWRLTIDISNWPSFTPTVRSVERLDEGPVQVGSSARLKQPGQTPAVWTVTRLEPEREFTWQTRRMGLTMVGSHRLEPTAGGCRNTLTLDTTGRGARLFAAFFGSMLQKAITTENAGFKARAERPPRSAQLPGSSGYESAP